MLSAGFCHLLADALRHLAFVGRFPMAPFLSATGYLITLLADQIVQLLTTDAEGHQEQHQLGSPGFWPPPAEPGSSLDFSSRPGPGFGRGAAAPSPAGSGFAGFLRSGLAGQKKAGWGAYSRLEEDTYLMQQQQHPGSNSCKERDIELSESNVAGHDSSSRKDAAGAALWTANGDGAATHACSNRTADAGATRQQPHGCSENPGSCPCCAAGGVVPDAEGSTGPSLGPQNPGSSGQAAAAVGYSRRPGSAGGLDRAGLGLGPMARTRSLTSPNSAVVGPALSPLQAAAARELGSPASRAAAPVSGWHAGAVDAGAVVGAASGNQSAAAAAVSPRPLLPVSTTPAPLQDDATCLLAAGSPRCVSAAGLHPRSPKLKPGAAAAGLIHQQQQQHANGHHHLQQQADQQPPLQPPLPLQQQQQQQHLLSPSEQQQHRAAAGSSSIGHLLLQPVRQLSLPTGCGGSCCCCAGGGCRSGLPSAQPDMTEACTVARVAGHLELEVMSTTTGGHNHGHFQVCVAPPLWAW